MIKIAVSKGRIERDFCKILNKVGYDIEPIINKKRKLLIKLEDNIEMIFVKADDVGTYLKYGSADIGIVGNDVLIEQGLTNYFELLDLNIGKCKFCLASNSSFNKDSLDKVIATKYPKITRQFFNSKKEKVKIVKLNGSVELGPIVKISDAIVDIVETGDTLRENGLEVVEEICDISTRLVANKSSLDLKKNEIYSFVNRLEEGIKC